MTKVDLEVKPNWLELPEEEKQKHVYWVCQGVFLDYDKRGKPVIPGWSVLYHSAEEAEAHSYSISGDRWVWDGEPARQRTLSSAMQRIRQRGGFGVRIKGWKDGEWATLKEYPAGTPLLNE